jgi:predicted GH43/DUF377 family glycosyl hydrolase
MTTGLFNSWSKDNTNNPLLTKSSSGWDDDDVLSPAVHLDQSDTYQMIYRGHDGATYRLGHATSSDLISWTKDSNNPVLSPGPSGSWDDTHLRGGTTLFTDSDGTAHLFYRGYNGVRYQVGHATSSNFSTWTKDPDNPVLSPSSSGWDSANIHKLSVIRDSGKWHGIYAADDGSGVVRLGYATSTDLVNWNKQQNANPVLEPGSDLDRQGVRKPDLHKVNDSYELLYNAVDTDGTTRRVGYAASETLVTWDKSDANAVLKPSGSGFDSKQIREMSAVYTGAQWSLLYGGYNGTEFAIGTADAQ